MGSIVTSLSQNSDISSESPDDKLDNDQNVNLERKERLHEKITKMTNFTNQLINTVTDLHQNEFINKSDDIILITIFQRILNILEDKLRKVISNINEILFLIDNDELNVDRRLEINAAEIMIIEKHIDDIKYLIGDIKPTEEIKSNDEIDEDDISEKESEQGDEPENKQEAENEDEQEVDIINENKPLAEEKPNQILNLNISKKLDNKKKTVITMGNYKGKSFDWIIKNDPSRAKAYFNDRAPTHNDLKNYIYKKIGHSNDFIRSANKMQIRYYPFYEDVKLWDITFICKRYPKFDNIVDALVSACDNKLEIKESNNRCAARRCINRNDILETCEASEIKEYNALIPWFNLHKLGVIIVDEKSKILYHHERIGKNRSITYSFILMKFNDSYYVFNKYACDLISKVAGKITIGTIIYKNVAHELSKKTILLNLYLDIIIQNKRTSEISENKKLIQSVDERKITFKGKYKGNLFRDVIANISYCKRIYGTKETDGNKMEFRLFIEEHLSHVIPTATQRIAKATGVSTLMECLGFDSKFIEIISDLSPKLLEHDDGTITCPEWYASNKNFGAIVGKAMEYLIMREISIIRDYDLTEVISQSHFHDFILDNDIICDFIEYRMRAVNTNCLDDEKTMEELKVVKATSTLSAQLFKKMINIIFGSELLNDSFIIAIILHMYKMIINDIHNILNLAINTYKIYCFGIRHSKLDLIDREKIIYSYRRFRNKTVPSHDVVNDIVNLCTINGTSDTSRQLLNIPDKTLDRKIIDSIVKHVRSLKINDKLAFSETITYNKIKGIFDILIGDELIDLKSYLSSSKGRSIRDFYQLLIYASILKMKGGVKINKLTIYNPLKCYEYSLDISNWHHEKTIFDIIDHHRSKHKETIIRRILLNDNPFIIRHLCEKIISIFNSKCTYEITPYHKFDKAKSKH